MKRPSFQFYPDDWLGDINLNLCSLGAQGLWLRLMCYMHQGEPYGYLRVKGEVIPQDKVSELVGKPPEVVTPLLDELRRWKVYSQDETGCIYSRRMVEDERKRQFSAEQGAKGGNPKITKKKKDNGVVNHPLNPESTPPDKPNPTPSSPSSSSSSNIDHIEEAAAPVVTDEPPPLKVVEEYLSGRTQVLVLGGGDIEAVKGWLKMTGGDTKVICDGIDAGLLVFQKDNPGGVPRSARFYAGYVEKEWDRHRGGASHGRSNTPSNGDAQGQTPGVGPDSNRNGSNSSTHRRGGQATRRTSGGFNDLSVPD